MVVLSRFILVSVIIIAYIAFWVFILPFVLSLQSQVFFFVNTSTQLWLCLCSVVLNGTSVYILHKTKQVGDKQLYLFVLLVLSSILQILLLTTADIIQDWVYLYENKKLNDTHVLYETYRVLSSTSVSLSAVYSSSLSIIFFTRLCFTLKKKTSSLRITKRVVIVFTIIYFAAITVLYYRYFLQKWYEIVTALLIFYIPCFFAIISAGSNFVIIRLQPTYTYKRTEITTKTLVSIFTFFCIFNSLNNVALVMDAYCCEIPYEHLDSLVHMYTSLTLLNCFGTTMSLVVCDTRYRYEFLAVLKRIFGKTGSVVNFENNAIYDSNLTYDLNQNGDIGDVNVVYSTAGEGISYSTAGEGISIYDPNVESDRLKLMECD